MSKAAGGSKRNRNRKVRKDNPLSYQVNHFIIGKRCDNCDKRDSDGVHIRFCSGCKSKDYCSPECQRAAWPSHKAICKETQNAKKDAGFDENGMDAGGGPSPDAEFKAWYKVMCPLWSLSGTTEPESSNHRRFNDRNVRHPSNQLRALPYD